MSNNNNSKTYKATFLIDSRKLDQPIEAFVEYIKSVVEEIVGKEAVSDVKSLGSHSLARHPDAGFVSANFLQIDFNGATTAPAVLHKKFHLNKTVNRILIETL